MPLLGRLMSALPVGFWFGELTGSGNGLCHVFPDRDEDDPQRLPHRAVCGAGTGRGAVLVNEPWPRPMCRNCVLWHFDHLVEVEVVAIPDDIAYPVWSSDCVLVDGPGGQRRRVEL